MYTHINTRLRELGMRHYWMLLGVISLMRACDEGGDNKPVGTLNPLGMIDGSAGAPSNGGTVVGGRVMTTIDMTAPQETDAQPSPGGNTISSDSGTSDMGVDAVAPDQMMADAFVPIDCNDGVDNDDDGLADYPLDPGCASLNDMDEVDPELPACKDGVDNDGDDKTDHPDDPGCSSPNDPSESTVCAEGIQFVDITGQTRIEGTTRVEPHSSIFAATNRAPEAVFLFTLRRPISRLRIDTIGSTFDTLLAVWRRCDDPESEITCSDDISPGRRVSEVLLNSPHLAIISFSWTVTVGQRGISF